MFRNGFGNVLPFGIYERQIALLVSDKKVQNYLKNGGGSMMISDEFINLPAETDCEEIDTPGCVAFDKVYTR